MFGDLKEMEVLDRNIALWELETDFLQKNRINKVLPKLVIGYKR